MQTPEQSTEQSTEQRRVGNPNWRPGVSANPRGRQTKAEREARLRAKCHQLARPFGGWGKLGVLDKVRIEQAARLLLDKRHRSPEDEIRYVNSIERLRRSVEARRGRREQHKPGPFANFDLLPDGAP